MSLSDDNIPLLQFKRELLGGFIRWIEESDLDEFELVEGAAGTINEFMNEDVVSFEPDDILLDGIDDGPEAA